MKHTVTIYELQNASATRSRYVLAVDGKLTPGTHGLITRCGEGTHTRAEAVEGADILRTRLSQREAALEAARRLVSEQDNSTNRITLVQCQGHLDRTLGLYSFPIPASLLKGQLVAI